MYDADESRWKKKLDYTLDSFLIKADTYKYSTTLTSTLQQQRTNSLTIKNKRG